jgi:hypothetical protein
MRILITNERLDQRAGSDLFARDLARGLQSRGHFVVVYSSDRHQLERLLERDSIPVVVDLEKLPFRPDVIHARHHLDAMTAVMTLSGVPAIYHCVGPSWATVVPKHPRILRYVAPTAQIVSVLEREGIGSDQIDPIPNAIDLERFARMREPAAVPTRALVYDDLLTMEAPFVQAITAELRRDGIDVAFVGRRFGRVIEDPERQLLDYDIVFASGRKAIEAIACGCYVFVIGTAEPVEPANFDRLRRANFAKAEEHSGTATVSHALRRYSPDACIHLARRVRAEAGLPGFVRDLEQTYQSAMSSNRQQDIDLDGEDRSTSAYLHKLGKLIKETDFKQKSEGNLPLSAASMFLDVTAKLASIEVDLNKPWWPDQRRD